MNELGRAIYDLERCTCHVPDACRDCSKYGAQTRKTSEFCMEDLMADALELLKELEPVYPKLKQTSASLYWTCGNCGEKLPRIGYCPKCGRKVKWDE